MALIDVEVLETALNNLIVDAENGSRLYNDPPGDVALRTGEIIANLRKRLAAVGHAVPVAFSSGLIVDSAAFTVTHEGSIFAANPDSVPFTTTSVFNPAQWVMVHREGLPTAAEVASRIIPGFVQTIQTSGWDEPDGVSGGTYVKVDVAPAQGGLVSLDGANWQLTPDERGYNLLAAGWGTASHADRAVIIQGLATMAGVGGRLYIPAGDYTWECTVSDFFTGASNNTGVLLEGYTDLTIDLTGVILRQFITYPNGAKTAAHFVFKDCVNCWILGGTARGSWIMVGEHETAALLGVRGACVNCGIIDGNAIGGSRIAYAASSNFLESGTKPTGTKFSGYGEDCHKPFTWTHVGPGNEVDLRFYNCLRAVYITGTKGLAGRIVGDLTHASCIMLNTRDGGATEDIDLQVSITRAFTGIDIAVSDATACLLKNIRISGQIECNSPTSGGGKGFIIGNTMGAVGTVIDHVDLSDLTIIQKRDTRVGEIIPNLAGTIRDILLPQFEQQGNSDGIIVDNAIGAVFQGLTRIGGRWRYTNGTPISALLLKSTGGQVDDVHLLAVRGRSNTTGSQDIQITNGGGVEIDGCRMQKAIFTVGSTNHKPDCVNDHNGQGFVYSGAIADLFVVSWLDTINLTGGSATINTLRRAVTGQIVTIVGAGGTQTFANGTNMILTGGVNMVMALNKTLVLRCKAGGESSVFVELSRS